MATFESAAKRYVWKTLALSIITDYAIAVVLVRLANDDAWPTVLGIAAALLIGFYILQALYQGICLLRAIYLVNRPQKQRAIADMVKGMHRTRMPVPLTFYERPEDYLESVISSPVADGEAKALAGAMLGRLGALRETGWYAGINYTGLLEEAISQYAREAG